MKSYKEYTFLLEKRKKRKKRKKRTKSVGIYGYYGVPYYYGGVIGNSEGSSEGGGGE